MDITLILLFAVIALAIFLFEWAMLRSVYAPARRDDGKIKERIDQLKQKTKEKNQESDSLIKGNYKEKKSTFYQSALQLPGIGTIPLWIEQSGLSIKLNNFLWTMGGIGIATFSIIFASSLNLLYALIGGILGTLLPVFHLYRKKIKRLEDFDSHLPDAMDIMTRALRAGHPFNTTLQLVANELKGPIAEEMAITFAELNFGVSNKDALTDLIRRVPSKPLKSLVTAILLQKETGGNLAEILEKISTVVREGYRFQRKIKTLSAEGKMSAIVLSSVPIVLGLGLYTIQPDTMSELVTNPSGIELLKIAAVLYTIGFVWIKILIKIEV